MIMPMSDEERRQLLEIETHLRQEPGLVKLSRQLSAANVYTPLRRLTVLTAGGGAIGLILLVLGAVLHNSVWIAGVGVLAATQVIVGVSAIVVEVRAHRREQRPDPGQHPHSPTR
jgi:Protein of unknown function (DUF3040)